MAQWWELAIPTVGTLMGAAIGAGSQFKLRSNTTQHEHNMRLLDEKITVYSKVCTEIRSIPRVWGELNKRLEYIEKHRAEMNEITARSEPIRARLTTADTQIQGLIAQIDGVMAEGQLDRMKALSDKIHAAVESRKTTAGELDPVVAELKAHSEKLQEDMSGLRAKVDTREFTILIDQLTLIAPPAVDQAAQALFDASKTNDPAEMRRLRDDLLNAIRQDLLGERNNGVVVGGVVRPRSGQGR